MGIVKYTESKKFNIVQAFQDGFGLDWTGDDCVVGLKLVGRKNKKIKAEIVGYDWFMGTFRVFYKGGGWNCFDHCVEQFEIDTEDTA